MTRRGSVISVLSEEDGRWRHFLRVTADKSGAQTIYQIRETDGNDLPPRLRGAFDVTLTGTEEERTLWVTASDIEKVVPRQARADEAPPTNELTSGDLRLSVIPVDYQDRTLDARCSDRMIHHRVNGHERSVRTIFESASRNKLRVVTSMHPRLRLPRPAPTTSLCMIEVVNVITEARELANPDLLANAEVEIYIVPAAVQCNFAGLSFIYPTPAGPRHTNLIFDTPYPVTPTCAYAMPYAHEIGHSMGLGHTYSRIATGVPVELADESGIMSAHVASQKQFQSPHTEKIGWIPPERKVELEHEATHDTYRRMSLGALASTSGDLELIKVKDPALASNDYFVSYRSTAVPVDSGLIAPYNGRLSIHRGINLETTLPRYGSFVDSQYGTMIHLRASDALQADVTTSSRINLTPGSLANRDVYAAAANHGDYLVAWLRQTRDDPAEIRMRTLDVHGVASSTVIIARPTGIASDSAPSQIAVAAGVGSQYLVLWSENAPGYEGVYAVLVSTANASPVVLSTEPIRIGSAIGQNIRYGEVTAAHRIKGKTPAETNTFILAWEAFLSDGRPTIRSASLRVTGTQVPRKQRSSPGSLSDASASGLEVHGVTPLTSNTTYPRIVCTDHLCLVTSVGIHTVYGTLLESGKPVRTRALSTIDTGRQLNPEVAASPTTTDASRFMVVWERNGVDGKRQVVVGAVSTELNVRELRTLGNASSLPSGEDHAYPNVAFDAARGFLVSYLEIRNRSKFHVAVPLDPDNIFSEVSFYPIKLSRPRDARRGVLARTNWTSVPAHNPQLFLWTRPATTTSSEQLYSRLF